MLADDFVRALSTEGSNRQKVDAAYPYLTNIFELAVSDRTEGVIAMQYQIMTNALVLRPQINGLVRENFSPIRNLLATVLSLPAIQSNPEAIAYCADFVGSMQCISTNNYAFELSEAATTNGVRACVERWRPVFDYNARVDDFREELVTVLSSAYMACAGIMQDADREAFATNVITRARLNYAETLRLRAGTDDELYETISRGPN